MGALVGLVGVVVSIAGATGKHKAWSLLTLSPPLVAWVLVQVDLRPTRWFGFDSPCVTLLNQQAHELITWSFALSALAVAQLVITLVLTASGKHRFGWATCVLLAMALATGAMVGVHRRAAVLSFHASVMEAQPVPHVIPPNLPPRAHVGLRRFVEPQLLHAGARTGFIFTSTVALDPRAARASSAWSSRRSALASPSSSSTGLGGPSASTSLTPSRASPTKGRRGCRSRLEIGLSSSRPTRSAWTPRNESTWCERL